MTERPTAEAGSPPEADREMREDRRTVTAVFADVVGSTTLAETLGAEDARLILAEAIGRIVLTVERFEGTVKDLAGDGVLALFGAPTAHEDDPERAVRAGLEIVREIREYGQEVREAWGVEDFAVRVGIETGPVVLGQVGAGSRVEYGAFGGAVNVAARLQAAAEPATVLVADAAYAAVAPVFVWGSPSELRLKGISEPMTARVAQRVGPSGLRVRGLAGLQGPFVGRERAFGEARERLDAVRGGSGGVLFVTGEAGIGKSRFVVELRAAFEASVGATGPDVAGQAASAPSVGTWLEGRCVSYGEALPYWPFRDLLRGWLGAGPDEPELRLRLSLKRSMERLFGDRASEMYPYLGAVLGLAQEGAAAARLAELSPEALQYRTFEVFEHLFTRLAQDGPVVLELEDLHWADSTSIQLTERLLALTEEVALLVVIGMRPERDHPAWRLRDIAERTLPHRSREIALEPLSDDQDEALLEALVGAETLPDAIRRRILESAEGNPFYLEELVRSLTDCGALIREASGWRYVHDVAVEVPLTIESVILARVDRLPAAPRRVLEAASVLGRRFGLSHLEAVAEGDGTVREAVRELQRLDLVREGRRWPEPEYRFKHALIQEATYRSLVARRRTALHRRAAEWLEERFAANRDEVLGLLAYHWLAADDESKASAYLTAAGDKARQEYALDEAIDDYRQLLPLLERRGERQEMALVLFKLALALHTSLRFAEANATYQRAFGLWTPEEPPAEAVTARLRIATSFLPNDPDPRSAIAWPNIQLCMQLFDRLVEAWPGRTIVPGLAERWKISDDGLRYVFHLREGLRWSDGTPLTAHDVEFGIKRVLDPRRPGSSVAIYFVLENGQDYYLGRNADASRIGVRALDDRTVEFRLVAPAPYFMSVLNRPDSGPQPRHAIERDGDAWIDPDRQVVSGPFRTVARTETTLLLGRRADGRSRRGNVHEVEFFRTAIADVMGDFRAGALDLILARYTPRLADLMPGAVPAEAKLGAAAWSAYLRFDHTHPVTSNLDFRRALAHAIDREELARAYSANLIVATGGVVPPALQGHTPEISLRYDPDLARDYLARSGFKGRFELAGMEVWDSILRVIGASWERVFGHGVEVHTWSWLAEEAIHAGGRPDTAYLRVTGWLPGYPDPEYYLRLLFHSASRTNEGGFSYPPFDDLIERARQERSDRSRLELFHEADRMAVADRVACIPLAYGRSVAYVQPWIDGWWEFGKSSASFADLTVGPSSPRR